MKKIRSFAAFLIILLMAIAPGCSESALNTAQPAFSATPAPPTAALETDGPAGNVPAAVSFIESQQGIVGVDTWDVSLADADNDGDLDAYFGYCLWLNDGSGNFTKTETTFGEKDAWFADFNGDGHPDAVCDNKILINDGSGIFNETYEIPSDIDMSYAVPADIDSDGDIDLISADEKSDRVFLNDGKGTFSDPGVTLGGWAQCRYAVGDINADGFNDVYAAIPHTPAPAMLDTRDKIWLGDGKGGFTEKENDIEDRESRDVIMADFDNDGCGDLFVADGVSASRLLLNDGVGNFTDSGQRINAAYHAAAAKAADINGDGYLDIMIANGKPLDNGPPNTIWLGDGKGNFTDSALKLGSSNSIQLALGDLDGDGDIDAFIVNVDMESGSAPVEIWFNQGGV